MTVVVDANVVLAVASASPQRVAARERVERWLAAGEDLHAPHLFTYEMASALCRLEAQGHMSRAACDEVWSLVDALDIALHPASHGTALVAIARRLRRRNAYDAAYVELALQLGTWLWTLDGRLARNAESLGFPVTLVV